MDEKLEPYKYLLVIKVPLEAIDNIQARQMAKGYLDTMTLPEGATTKLQRLEARKEPVGVPL